MKKRLLVACLLILLSASAANAQKAPASSVKTSAEAKTGRLYGIGSVSKVFCSAAVMKLEEEGKIDLDEPVVTYIPEFVMADERYTHITSRMLLNHSSGLMGSTGGNIYLLDDNDTVNTDQFLNFLACQTLKHDPGERSVFCNDGFTLAEILIERVSGVSYTDFIRQNFLVPLGIENIKTPQSDFDRTKLADMYMGNNELKPINGNAIGAGGIYATMEDLCRYATIYMDSADNSILSKRSINEMAKNQHKMELVPSDTDTIVRYGLGWNSVETYPFNRLGIKVLSSSGSIARYSSNLTVLPEYNLAAAVSTSGTTTISYDQLIAQEIILAVLEEEGLIPRGTTIVMPAQNIKRAKIPEGLKSYAGIYDAGVFGGLISVVFTEDTLIITQIAARNERPQEFIYNTDGEFASVNGEYFGRIPGDDGVIGVSTLSFTEGKYLLLQTYRELQGLSQSVMTMPYAAKIEANSVSKEALDAWSARNSKEYLLVSEKYTSAQYIIGGQIVKTLTDDHAPGYVSKGIYRAGEMSGRLIAPAKIIDENTAIGYQNTPTETGRDINNLYISLENEVEYLSVNDQRFIDAAAAKKFAAIGERITVDLETVWVDIGNGANRRIMSITTPPNGSWFVYDEKMNCIATSLEKNPRATVILPENGRLAFAGVAGAEFVLN